MEDATPTSETSTHQLMTIIERGHLFRRRFYTALLFAVFLLYGASYNIWGVSWNALIALFNTDQESMAYANSLFAVGYVCSAFTCPFIFRHFDRQLSLTFYTLIMSVCIGATPLMRSLDWFLATAFFFGISEGGVDTATVSWLLEMYTENNNSLMQAIYFFFGLGTFLAPMIELQFLSSENNLNEFRSAMLNQTGSELRSKSDIELLNETFIKSDISVPFFTLSSCILVISTINLLSYIFFRYEPLPESTILRLKTGSVDGSSVEKKPMETYGTIASESSKLLTVVLPEKELEHPEPGWSRKLILLVIVASVIGCFYDGYENTTFEYFSSFLIFSPFACSEATAAQISSILSGSFTVARFFAIITVKWMSTKTFLVLDTILMFSGVTLVYYSIQYAEPDKPNELLFLGTILWGAGMSTFLPAFYSYLETHLRMTDTVCAVLHLASSTATPFLAILIGKFIVRIPEIVLYICYLCLVIAAFALSIFECIKSIL